MTDLCHSRGPLLKGFDLAADASYAAERPFFIFR